MSNRAKSNISDLEGGDFGGKEGEKLLVGSQVGFGVLVYVRVLGRRKDVLLENTPSIQSIYLDQVTLVPSNSCEFCIENYPIILH